MPGSPESILLGVNIDHAATLRQARYRGAAHSHGSSVEPDPVDVALMAERAGADAITMHLREDRRHIQDEDVERMRATIRTRLNLEMAATVEMEAIALRIRPDVVLLVPEGRNEVTTEGGLDVKSSMTTLRSLIQRLNASGVGVSLFIDPETEQIEAAASVGAQMVELHTGAFANAWAQRNRVDAEVERLHNSATFAHDTGLMVNAGHGINYHNVRLVRSMPHLREFNIGHTIISRAVITGINEAVATMKRLINS